MRGESLCLGLHQICSGTIPANTHTSIHDLGIVGHVEEIAVRGDYQGQGIGIRILAGLTSIAEGVGCYKSTLQCSEKNEPFYLKCGYEKREGKVMSQYYEEIKESCMRG